MCDSPFNLTKDTPLVEDAEISARAATSATGGCSPTPRAIATAPVRTISTMPNGREHLDEAVDLVLRAR